MTLGPVGLELELLAPSGKTRFDLARALAKQAGGALRLSFKYHGQGVLPDGRPDCHLTPGARVVVDGEWFCSLVDDPTIVDELAPEANLCRIARTDDCAVGGVDRAQLPRHVWSAEEDLRGDGGRRWIRRSVGAAAGALARESPKSACALAEVVLRPLVAKELAPTLRRVMKLAASEVSTVPAEGAIHAHYDAERFRSTPVLRRLVSKWTEEREQWLAKLEPNPRCRKLGPFPPDVVRVAREASDDRPASRRSPRPCCSVGCTAQST